MKTLLNSSAFYFLFPIYTALLLIFVFYYIPEGFGPSLFSLVLVITPIFLLSGLVYPFKLEIDKCFQYVYQNSRHKFIILLLVAAIVACGPLDIMINGFKLTNPLSYAEFHGIGRYVRHISSLCWIFVPVAFIFIKSRVTKAALILYAIIFPILIIDRNRLFMAFYSLMLCVVLIYLPSLDAKVSRKLRTLYVYLLPVVLLVIFAVVGLFRSGSAFIVESSGDSLIPGAFPLREYFFSVPDIVQQIILYITAPTFNFATVVFYDFTNPDFLLSQLSPFGREAFDAYPYAPIMVERYNVGTEFYPWLTYGGVSWVLLSFTFMLFSFLCAVSFFRRKANIFSLLIFIKISYAVIFMGFAPQFYILLNFMFIFMMLGMWLVSWSIGTWYFNFYGPHVKV